MALEPVTEEPVAELAMGVWSKSKPGSASKARSCWGGPRAGERGGGVVGRPRWARMASTGSAAVMKARMRMSPPQSVQVRGKTS